MKKPLRDEAPCEMPLGTQKLLLQVYGAMEEYLNQENASSDQSRIVEWVSQKVGVGRSEIERALYWLSTVGKKIVSLENYVRDSHQQEHPSCNEDPHDAMTMLATGREWVYLKDTLPDSDQSDNSLTADLRDIFRRLFNPLLDREQKVLNLRYGLWCGYDYTQEEVAYSLKRTRSRISQIEQDAIRKLQQPSCLQELADFLPTEKDSKELPRPNMRERILSDYPLALANHALERGDEQTYWGSLEDIRKMYGRDETRHTPLRTIYVSEEHRMEQEGSLPHAQEEIANTEETTLSAEAGMNESE